MNILFIERNLAADSLVYDQITRISQYVDSQIIAVQMGGFSILRAPGVINLQCPFIPKIEWLKGWSFCQCVKNKFTSLSKEFSIDLIHAHFAYPEGLAAYHIFKQFGIPYMITARGTDVLIYPQRNRYLKKNISRVLNRCSGIITVSNHLKQRAITLGANSNRCHFLPDGIPEEIFLANSALAKDRVPKRVLFAGSLLSVKNVLRMLDAFKLAHEKISELTFEIAGQGPLESQMRAKLNKQPLGKNVRFLGQISPSTLANHMRKAAVLCLPSVSEGWPNVVMEAMACGTPVVGAEVGGIPEQIISEQYGFLCNPYSPMDIAEKLCCAVNTQWDHEAISERGRRFTRDNTAKSIVSIYKKIVFRNKIEFSS